MKSAKKYLALILACLMVVVLLAGCNKDSGNTTTPPTNPGTGTDTPTDELEISPREVPSDYNPTNDTLTIGTTEFNGVFNYLFYNSAYDANIVDLTGIGIYETGRGGALVEGACFYKTPEIIKDEAGNDVAAKYTFQIKKGVTFSDGKQITADDIIFTYKCMVSTAYEGLASLQTLPIPGLMEYRYDDADYAAKLEEMQALANDVSDDEIKAAIHEMDVADYEAYGVDLIGYYGLTVDEALEPGSDEYREAVIAVLDEANFKTDYDYFFAEISGAKYKELESEYVKANMAGGESISDIEGIKKIDEYTVEVTVNGIDPTAESQLAVLILPAHYYGEGITKTDFSAMKAKNSAPMGGGPYTFVSFKDNEVVLKANPLYYKGKPLIENIRYQVIPVSDQASAAANGTVDVMEVSCTPDYVAMMQEAGKYTMTYDRNGWGYVGVSAKMIPDINVRKGLMHAMNRELGVNTYYGDLAVVLERPITMASWGYPSDNTPVYTYDLAKAEEYFLAAGYVKEDGKLMKDGKQLTFNAYISDTDHPVTPLYTQMKLDLETMGAIFTIEQIDWAAYSEMYSEGDAMIWAAAYGDGSPDPDPYQYFHSDSIAAKNNPYYINDPEVDKLIMEGRSVLDQEARKPIYNELYKKVMDTATVMPYYQRMEMYVVNPDIVDIDTLTSDPDPFYGFYANILDLRLK